uniref:INO80 complex subunit B n=1 Tax=Myotis myotis TaxID=51298 RepID=A0A7J7U575_MYOMY|nr:INO80 complex subunit B [Myotis myotis]
MSKLWRRGSTSGAMEAPEPGEALELSLAGAHGHGVHKKKHKKHKKKHKKKHHQEEEAGPTQPSPAKPQLKLKIKLGGQVLGTKSVPTFTVIPEGPRSPSPLMVVDNEEEPMEGGPHGALQQRGTGFHPFLPTWRPHPRTSVSAATPAWPSSAVFGPWLSAPAPLRLLPHRPGTLQPAVLPHQPADAPGETRRPRVPPFGYLRPVTRTLYPPPCPIQCLPY